MPHHRLHGKRVGTVGTCSCIHVVASHTRRHPSRPQDHVQEKRTKDKVLLAHLEPAGEALPLLDVETSMLGLTNPSIDCLTFYEGVPPTATLKTRLRAMVKANPWAAGRLRSGEGGSISLWVPDSANASVRVMEATVDGLRTDMPPAEAIAACGKYGVKIGLECIDKDEPLLKVSVLKTGGQKFALLVSLSHVIGDAATYYNLYGMLDPSSTPPVALDPTRLSGVYGVEPLRKSFGPEIAGGHTQLKNAKAEEVTQNVQMLYAMSRAPARQKEVRLHLIDETWVAKQKELHAAEAKAANFEFLSTNDVLSAWYCGHVDASRGTVVCDCRGRLPGVPAMQDDFKPGNYLASVSCYAEDYATPVTIRRKVNDTLSRVAAGTSHLETAVPKGANAKVANLTNWSSLYVHLQLPECRHVAHFPIVNSITDATHGNLYIFRPRDGQLAVLNFQRGYSGVDKDTPLLPWGTL